MDVMLLTIGLANSVQAIGVLPSTVVVYPSMRYSVEARAISRDWNVRAE